MSLILYYHPFSSFCQKVLIALYEKEIPFTPRLIDLSDPAARSELEAASTLAKFPVLSDEVRGRFIPESSSIIEYLDLHFPGKARLIPVDAEQALEVRLLDRLFDNYVDTPLATIVLDRFRPEGSNDPIAVEQARSLIGRGYAAIEARLGEDGWAVGRSFSLADCAAAPALFYANTAVPLDEYPRLGAYYRRLLSRPSFARAVEEARPYRGPYPLAWPDEY